ncbi:MAG: CCA tRNA nucleotidyltransferase [Candidatus Micrarchaeota archaeon]
MKDDFLKNVLEGIKPTKEEDRYEKKLAAKCIKKLQATSKEFIAVLVGSIAKGTYLRQSTDIDIFLLFDRKKNKNEFEIVVRNCVEEAFPNERYEISYAEHPYIKLYYKGKKIDVVPAYRIKNATEMASAVDRSVLHTKYIIKNLKKDMVEEVLLLKKFLKSNELYGAQIRYEGISGYLCELLILKYKTFLNTLKNAQNWEEGTLLQLEKIDKKTEIDRIRKKFNAPLIFIDPTDRNRNVAAAFSLNNFKIFKKLTKKFLKNPTKRFFDDPQTFEQKLAKMKAKYEHIYELEILKPDLNEDILWGQIKRSEKLLNNYLRQNGFKTLQSLIDVNENKIRIILRLKEKELSKFRIMIGPEIKRKEHLRDFKKAHAKSRMFIEAGRIKAEVKRKIRNIEIALRLFLPQLDRIKNFKNLDKKIIEIRKN